MFLCVSRYLTTQTKLKFDHDFKACWSYCFELKVLIESKHAMPWVICGFGNVFLQLSNIYYYYIYIYQIVDRWFLVLTNLKSPHYIMTIGFEILYCDSVPSWIVKYFIGVNDGPLLQMESFKIDWMFPPLEQSLGDIAII